MPESIPTVHVDPDAPPIAQLLAAMLRTKFENPQNVASARRLRGGLALRHLGPDVIEATVRFAGDRIEVVGGVDPDAKVTVTADLLMLGQAEAPRPKPKGALMHLAFATRAGKLLRPEPS